MANVVASIIASLGLDARSFKAEIAAAEKVVGDFGKGLTSIPGLAGFLGAAGIGAAAHEILDTAKHVQYLSERFGVSTDVIQRWGHAAEAAGSSLEAMTMGFNRLDVSRSKALGGNQETLTSFNNLGISIGDLEHLSPDELMKKIGASSMNAADMVALLGRNGTELRPVLEGLASGTLKFGAAISSVDVKQLAEADEILKRLGQHATVEAAGVAGFFASFGKGVSAVFSGGDAWKKYRQQVEDARQVLVEQGRLDVGSLDEEHRKALEERLGKLGEGRLSEEQQRMAEAARAKPRTRPEEEQGRLNEQVVKAKEMTAVLELQLDHQVALARALQTNIEFQEKINAANRAGLSDVAAELELQRQLTLQKQAQEITGKNAERTKLSLQELAESPSRFPSYDVLAARQAIREQALGEQERLAQHPAAAAFHFDLAEQIKASIPQLRESEKDISGQVRMGNDTSQIFQQLLEGIRAIQNFLNG